MVCQNCGTQFEEGIFCPECGTKYDDGSVSGIDITDSVIENIPMSDEEIEKTIDSALFYYEQSYEKKEFLLEVGQQRYYKMAQRELYSAYNRTRNNARILWELSKPVDFCSPEMEKGIAPTYSFNEEYYEKAVEFADISDKKEFISLYEKYNEKKNNAIEKNKEVKEKERQEDIKRQKELEEEETRKRKIREAKEEEERKKRAEENERKRDQELQEQRAREAEAAYNNKIKEEQDAKARAENEKRKSELKQYKKSLMYTTLGWICIITAILSIVFAILSLNNLKDFNPLELKEKVGKLKKNNYVMIIISVLLLVCVISDEILKRI